ncbi:hypothetical protein [Streptomyces sp. H27-C3]|uniref:hypothetical protein n=1 Tax=Streptomyces sp. H27-C3 TaxID=3046305 RepID=UPI0024BB3833|nr:hypothetical protein [Streptomyces sp. H27-C3]MDJ0462737.1 hypothetical protein [Streptomyces sp. H27-C3]
MTYETSFALVGQPARDRGTVLLGGRSGDVERGLLVAAVVPVEGGGRRDDAHEAEPDRGGDGGENDRPGEHEGS